MKNMINNKERLRLRELAKRQLELANSDRNKKLYKDWEVHGKTDGSGRPMITVEFSSFSDEFITPLLQCESDDARRLEYQLLETIYYGEKILDDTIIRNYTGYSEEYSLLPFGIEVRRDETGGLGHHFVSQLFDLSEDFGLLGKSTVFLQSGSKTAEFINETIGDILPVRKTGRPRSICLLQDIVHIMSMEDMYAAMCDEPELFSKMCGMLTDDYIEVIERTENEGLLMATNGDMWLCQGSLCFTDDLPKEGSGLKISQIWGYMDAQEAEGISGSMYHELVHPHHKRISERFGLLSYGCCEGVDRFWGDLSTLKNLRKISISAWSDERFMGQALQGRKTVYHRKPSPNFIGVDKVLDEDAVRANIKKTVQCAAGLTLEFSQRDVYTAHNDIGKVARYVEIIREECQNKR
jgi:hypothetical protein